MTNILFETMGQKTVKSLLIEKNIESLKGNVISKNFLRNFWYKVSVMKRNPYNNIVRALKCNRHKNGEYSIILGSYKLHFKILENTIIFTSY